MLMNNILLMLASPVNSTIITVLYLSAVGFGVFHWTDSAVSSVAAILLTIIYSAAIIGRATWINMEIEEKNLKRKLK